MPSERLVTLMELLRVYAENYVRSFNHLSVLSGILSNNLNDTMASAGPYVNSLRDAVSKLQELCRDGDLPVTKNPLDTLWFHLMLSSELASKRAIKELVDRALDRLPDEMSTKIYFQLPYSRKELYEEPRKKWDGVIARFPNAAQDIDESSKCFALSRYAACVFHCVQIIEHGLLALGVFLSVNDPLSGWTAVAKELKRICDKKRDERNDFEKAHSAFIEQMQGTVEALKNAWRNKIRHAHGQRLVLVDSEFTPDTAEEIMMATRSFMRRLADSLPG